ncbi:MAG: aldo/keto reductase [Pseudomonadota bacterium]
MTPETELVLGAVQIGLDYGATNTHGRPDDAAANAILDAALAEGIATIDTARAYGESEVRIGRFLSARPKADLRIVTKIAPDLGDDPVEATRASLETSREALGRERLDAVLFHRPAHLTTGGGAALDALTDEREAGRVGRIGVSLSEPEELEAALAFSAVGQVQFPFNALDGRFEGERTQAAIAARPDVVFHLRSAFLQGVLLAPDPRILTRIFGAEAGDVAAFIDGLPGGETTAGRLRALLAYACAQPWIDGVVTGAATAAEISEIAAAWRDAPAIADDVAAYVAAYRPNLPPETLNPANWSQS